MDNKILISVIIPVKNGAYWLPGTLTAITKQTLFRSSEIIIIDSGSTDATIEISKRFPVKLIEINPAEYNHGETRNLGAREAKGKYVVMTVQDAVPSDDEWLQKLLDGFIHDGVDGVCGQQIVPHNKIMNPVQWFRPQSEPVLTEYVFPDPEEFNRLSPANKRSACGWDNVNAMYRREALLKRPFRKVMFGEDIQWAKDTLLAGGNLVFNYAARVYHYHFENPDFTFKRVYTECFFKYRLFQLIPSPQIGLKNYLRDIKIILTERELGITQKIKWIIYNIKLRHTEYKVLCQFNKDVSRGDDFLIKKYFQAFPASPVAPVPF